jgi:Transmembrane amino acid transporter protein
MAEMRNPRDFWKSFLMAWSIIVAVYMTFGLYVYSQQGQFTYIPAVQGIGSYVPRTVGNSINIVVHVVAAAMYGNVCLKALYYPIVVDRLHGPRLETNRGHLVWSFMAIGVWIGAFIIASVIPNFGDLVGVVASLFVIQYTYTLPAFFVIAESKLRLQTTWVQAAYSHWFNTVFIVAALVATVLGSYSSIRSMTLDVREGTTPTAFSCRSPTQPR